MPNSTANRRVDARYDVPPTAGMKIEFIGADGVEYALPVVTLSVHGVSFSMLRKIQGIENGCHVGNVSIRMDKVQISGNLVVVYCGREFGADYICGAQFYPLGEADRNELVTVISQLKDIATV